MRFMAWSECAGLATFQHSSTSPGFLCPDTTGVAHFWASRSGRVSNQIDGGAHAAREREVQTQAAGVGLQYHPRLFAWVDRACPQHTLGPAKGQAGAHGQIAIQVT